MLKKRPDGIWSDRTAVAITASYNNTALKCVQNLFTGTISLHLDLGEENNVSSPLEERIKRTDCYVILKDLSGLFGL